MSNWVEEAIEQNRKRESEEDLGFEPTADEGWGGKALVQEIVTRSQPYPTIKIEAVTDEEAKELGDLPVETIEIGGSYA